MEFIQSALSNIMSPVVLPFFLGIFATLMKSELKVPEAVYSGLTIYLLLSLGLKGGSELTLFAPSEFLVPIAIAIVLAAVTCGVAWLFARHWLKFDVPNRAAMGAHYGSVSVVTYISALTFLESQSVEVEGYVSALLVVLEVPPF